MRQILFAFLFLTVSAFAQEKNKQIIIKGTINGDTKGFNKVYCYGEGIPKGLDKDGKILMKEIGFNSNGKSAIENELKLLFGFQMDWPIRNFINFGCEIALSIGHSLGSRTIKGKWCK